MNKTTETITDPNNPLYLAANMVEQAANEIGKTLHMDRTDIEYGVAALAIKGHMLTEGPPGSGKTDLTKTMSVVFGLDNSRIQGTEDLLVGDVLGGMHYQPKTGDFEFRAGPIFSSFVHVDEINRMPRKTQSGLMEAMAERQVTTDGESRALPRPFMVVATENPNVSSPLEQAATDRFDISIERRPYTSKDIAEIKTLKRIGHQTLTVAAVKDILKLQQQVETVVLNDAAEEFTNGLAEYILANQYVAPKLSTPLEGARGPLALAKVTQYNALKNRRPTATLHDAVEAAPYVFGHRFGLTLEGREETTTTKLTKILAHKYAGKFDKSFKKAS